ncbi:hypothetical protein WR25_24016 [Diploscapter pachys]|uniref:Uncharacterized protein n=1 Tax=Diploscapter pachys TaxID=2018661 RepID=A0A2A2M529_9BILA|nr:hypothetical protein WR25_24016 [Diploscapter pachys]
MSMDTKPIHFVINLSSIDVRMLEDMKSQTLMILSTMLKTLRHKTLHNKNMFKYIMHWRLVVFREPRLQTSSANQPSNRRLHSLKCKPLNPCRLTNQMVPRLQSSIRSQLLSNSQLHRNMIYICDLKNVSLLYKNI